MMLFLLLGCPAALVVSYCSGIQRSGPDPTAIINLKINKQ